MPVISCGVSCRRQVASETRRSARQWGRSLSRPAGGFQCYLPTTRHATGNHRHLQQIDADRKQKAVPRSPESHLYDNNAQAHAFEHDTIKPLDSILECVAVFESDCGQECCQIEVEAGHMSVPSCINSAQSRVAPVANTTYRKQAYSCDQRRDRCP